MSIFTCNICNKTFQSIYGLNGHNRSHGQSNGTNKQIMCCCIITKEVVKASYLDKFQKSLIQCKFCKNLFKSHIGYVFCSHSCSASFNNVLRDPKSTEQKQNISNSLKKYYNSNPKYKKIIEDKPTKVKNYRNCNHCQTTFFAQTYKKYCSDCSPYYMAEARNRYKFTFNVYKYPDLFDLDLINTVGWYAPGGKSGRWNINGLSRDHKVSVNSAILNNYDYYYITHPMNCEIITHKLNNTKKTRSSISYVDLVKLVDAFDAKMAPREGFDPPTL